MQVETAVVTGLSGLNATLSFLLITIWCVNY